MDYGFVMRHSRKENTYTLHTPNTVFADPTIVQATRRPSVYASSSLVCREVYETKERLAASPFGFGLTFSELSARKMYILSALGLSRLNL